MGIKQDSTIYLCAVYGRGVLCGLLFILGLILSVVLILESRRLMLSGLIATVFFVYCIGICELYDRLNNEVNRGKEYDD